MGGVFLRSEAPFTGDERGKSASSPLPRGVKKKVTEVSRGMNGTCSPYDTDKKQLLTMSLRKGDCTSREKKGGARPGPRLTEKEEEALYPVLQREGGVQELLRELENNTWYHAGKRKKKGNYPSVSKGRSHIGNEKTGHKGGGSNSMN